MFNPVANSIKVCLNFKVDEPIGAADNARVHAERIEDAQPRGRLVVYANGCGGFAPEHHEMLLPIIGKVLMGRAFRNVFVKFFNIEQHVDAKVVDLVRRTRIRCQQVIMPVACNDLPRVNFCTIFRTLKHQFPMFRNVLTPVKLNALLVRNRLVKRLNVIEKLTDGRVLLLPVGRNDVLENPDSCVRVKPRYLFKQLPFLCLRKRRGHDPVTNQPDFGLAKLVHPVQVRENDLR